MEPLNGTEKTISYTGNVTNRIKTILKFIFVQEVFSYFGIGHLASTKTYAL